MRADELWRRFRASGDPASLGAVFDAVSPELFRVALSLAPDAASAEDALQETWLVALKSAARHDAARPVVPWLVGILRRKVHEARRRMRRPDERRIARGAAPVDPSVAAQSREDTARLRAAIDELPASCREVAVLRWRYGLEPGEIADARGMPPGTVRSLLHRALARIKRQMKAAPALFLGARWPRGLDDVRAAVLRAAAHRSVIDGALASAGGLVMAKATKTAVIAAVACLLIGAGAAVRLSGHSAPARATPPVETADTATHAAARSRRGGAPDAESPAPAAEDAKPFARGIVVDEADAPIAGCRVLVRGHEDMGGIQDAPVRLDATAAAVTGADGRFVVPKRPDDLASLTFVADGYEAVEERSFDADLRVVLAASASFGATVVDTAGEPIAGADVRVMGAWLKSEPRWSCVWLRAATDAAGRFKFRSLPQDARLTWISKWGYRLPGPEMGALPEQDVYVLERSCLIVDVTDATTQEPIPYARGVLVRPDGALLGNLEPQPAIASTRARAGRLFWSRHPRIGDVAAELRVFAPGHRVQSMPLALATDAEPPLLAVALDPGEDAPMLAGRVAEGAGALVEARFTPRIDGTRIVYGTDLQLPIAAAATVAADGTFRITGIPAGAYRLTVTRPGEVPLAIDLEAPATSLELRFGPKAALTVRYVDTRGRAVSGAWIHVESPGTNVAWCVRTDASGVAAFDALPAAEVVAIPMHNTGILLQRGGVAGLSGFQPLPAEIRVLAAGQRESMVLTRPDPCRVSVVVRDDAGRPVPNVEIHAKAVYGFAFWLAEERDRLPLLDLSTDAEGRATFDVLPCRGEVKALRQGRVNTAEFVADVGSSPTVEIVLPSVTGVIRGRVLERGSGAPVVARPVKVWWDHKVIAESATGDDGRFTASGVPAGRVRVLVEGYTDANDSQGRRVDPKSPYGSAETEFEMAAGEDHSVALTLPRIKGKEAERTAAVVEATIVDAAGAPVAGSWMAVRGLVDGAWCSLGDARAGDDGRARLEVVAAERYRVRAWSGDRSAEVERDAAPALVERLVLAPK